jgi:hypothetical protein
MRSLSDSTLGGFQGARRNLELRIQAEYFVPGEIWLEDGKLLWNYNENDRRLSQFGGCLNGFLRLHSASPEYILAYAKRWGVIFGCVVHQHSDGTLPEITEPSDGLCFSRHPKGHQERIEDWRGASRELKGLLQIAYDVLCGRPGARESWELVHGFPVCVFGDLSSDRKELLNRLNGHLNAQLSWRDEAFSIEFRVGSLIELLLAQIALLMAQRGIAICANCGNVFPPKELKSGQRAYCDRPSCGRPAAVRAAQQRRYRKSRSQDRTSCDVDCDVTRSEIPRETNEY